MDSAAPMEVDEQKAEIDEGLYSRQLYVIDHASMKRVMESKVLIVGLSGLGVEAAKNIILTGVKSVTLYDPTLATLTDLSTNFFLTEEDIGRPRAKAVEAKLQELNTYVAVSTFEGDLSAEFVAGFRVVVLVDSTLDQQLLINDTCHNLNIPFISAETRGVFGSLFCDFGEKFVVLEINDEPPKSHFISAISQSNPALITVIDDSRLAFDDQSLVTFNVRGMEALNELGPQKITITDKFNFTVDVDTTSFPPFVSGTVTEFRPSKEVNFLSLRHALDKPEFIESDLGKIGVPAQIHVGFLALHEFQKAVGSLPRVHNQEDAERIVELAKEINNKGNYVEQLNEGLLKQLAYGSRGQIAPFSAFYGGVLGQEVIKACTGKFSPIKQFLYVDAMEALPEEGSQTPEDFQPTGSRYDGQIAVLGRRVQETLLNLRYFLVGSGAIGCEMLKDWALMGVGAGEHGIIHVTDMDTIEKSNLNRQFLFRPTDLERLKSEVAAEAVKKMNPHLNIRAYSLRVGQDTENIYNDKFYESLDGVCNALDNVEARMYMDTQCINYRLPLLESGTLGTKGNTQVVVPDLTESYASSRDPPEKSIPMCTLHHFPNKIEHTIQWARDYFEGTFKNTVDNVNAYLTQPKFFSSSGQQNISEKLETVRSVHECLVSDRAMSFEDCIHWARLKFTELFDHNIRQLLHNFPEDLITSSGAPFWSGTKRAPKPITFDLNNKLHLDFIVAAANLRAFNFGLKGHTNREAFKQVLANVIVPDFVPKKVFIPEGEAQQQQHQQQQQMRKDDDDDGQLNHLLSELPSPSELSGYRMNPAEFEKDNDANFHVDFVTACSNLRATNYSIENADRHTTKGIAGKIIPALVTTTAMVSGLVALELIKLAQKKPLSAYRNGFANLALPMLLFSEPMEPPRTKITDDWSWTLWDRFDLTGPLTIGELLDQFESKYKLEITMISCGLTLLYAFFSPNAQRRKTEISEVYRAVSGKPLPENNDYLALTLMCRSLETDDDVDVPWARYRFRNN